MASTIPNRSGPAPTKRARTTVDVQHLPPDLVALLDHRAGQIMAGSGHGQISIDIVEGHIKRFQALESFLFSATNL